MVGKYQQLKIGRSLKYCHFIKIIEVLEIVSSLQHQAKNMLEIYAIRYTSIWPHFMSIVRRIKKKISKNVTTIRRSVYDDVTDFEICGFHKNKNLDKKVHQKVHAHLPPILATLSISLWLKLWKNHIIIKLQDLAYGKNASD